MSTEGEQLWTEIGHLREAVDRNTTAVTAMGEAIQRLVRVEERQTEMKDGQTKFAAVIDRFDDRLRSVEASIPENLAGKLDIVTAEMPTLILAKNWALGAVALVMTIVGGALVVMLMKQ